MKVRYKVGRCCCAKGGTPGQPIPVSKAGAWAVAGALVNQISDPWNDWAAYWGHDGGAGEDVSARYAIPLVGVDQAATIISARLVVDICDFSAGHKTPVGAGPTGRFQAVADIRAEDVDNADAGFRTIADLDSAPRTTAEVALYSHWYDHTNGITSVVSEYPTGNRLETPDLAAIVQEVVNRPGWVAGNTLQLFFDFNAASTQPLPGTDCLGRLEENTPFEAYNLVIDYANDGLGGA